jgi:cobalamin biosynthesis protein CbiG
MWVNFIPALKWWPDTMWKIWKAKQVQARRVKLLRSLLDDLKAAEVKGRSIECIVTDLIKDEEAKVSKGTSHYLTNRKSFKLL